MEQLFEVGNFRIGKGFPTFIVAEIGINHNGDIMLAQEAIHAAAEAGANAVKFQNYYTEDFISDKTLMFTYTSQGKKITESQFEMFKRCELSRDQLAMLKETADAKGVNFHSTPTSQRGIEDLLSIGTEILKNGSDYLTNLNIVKQMGETGLLTVLSTGMATLSEIDFAVNIFKETGNEKLILLHCTSSYPTPPEEVNFSRIQSLQAVFGVPSGFSDHTSGVTAAIGAVVTGACWVEKHFTLDRNLPGPDHWFSMDPKELKDLVKSVRDTEKMIGDSKISPTPSEKINRQSFRLSCVAARDIPAGYCLSHEDITLKRPGEGFSPIQMDMLIGLRLEKPISKGEQFKKQHFSNS
jgi:N-acetylneuraminate synthase/N,N'-diacetyllegionaminate synthase